MLPPEIAHLLVLVIVITLLSHLAMLPASWQGNPYQPVVSYPERYNPVRSIRSNVPTWVKSSYWDRVSVVSRAGPPQASGREPPRASQSERPPTAYLRPLSMVRHRPIQGHITLRLSSSTSRLNVKALGETAVLFAGHWLILLPHVQTGTPPSY